MDLKKDDMFVQAHRLMEDVLNVWEQTECDTLDEFDKRYKNIFDVYAHHFRSLHFDRLLEEKHD